MHVTPNFGLPSAINHSDRSPIFTSQSQLLSKSEILSLTAIQLVPICTASAKKKTIFPDPVQPLHHW
jgi:hypothetical protein